MFVFFKKNHPFFFALFLSLSYHQFCFHLKNVSYCSRCIWCILNSEFRRAEDRWRHVLCQNTRAQQTVASRPRPRTEKVFMVKQKFYSMGGTPGLVVMGGDSWSEGNGFESQHCMLDGHFTTLSCCKNCNVCLKKQNKWKRVRDGHYFKI